MAEKLKVFSRDIAQKERNELLQSEIFKLASYLSLENRAIIARFLSNFIFEMRKYIFICCLVSASTLSFSQKVKPLPSLLPTGSIDIATNDDQAANRPKRKKISLIYVSNGDKILYGNPCAIDATHKMGFEYIVEPKSLGGSKSKSGKLLNNFLIKSKLVVTRSPFWKMILNRRFKQCRVQSGDIVGP